MTYTGKTQAGGPAQVRELPFVILSKLAVGPYDNNVYLLRCRETGEQLLIDAAADPEAILALVGPDGLAAIVTTHEHADHWQALGPVAAATGATTFAGRLDADGIPVATDILVDDGDVIAFGAVTLRAIHLVGHTPGSIALVYDDPDGHPHVFSGDCLFPGGVGKTADADAFASLYGGVVSKVFDVVPDETWVYPGHGDDTTVGRERPQLEEWAARGW